MARTEFYSTVAQVIPVVILALLFEKRVLDLRSEGGARSVGSLIMEAVGIYSLMLAEVAALTALFAGKDSSTARNVVILGVIFGVVPFVYDVVMVLGYSTWAVVNQALPERVPPARGKTPGRVATLILAVAIPFIVIKLAN